MDNEECEFDDSEDDSFEERWVPTDEAFEASILRTTGNNLDLAARLIPQLYEMFQQEESFVVGFWETCYRTRVGNPYDQGAGMPGGWGEPFSSNTGQNTNLGKRQRENEEENSQGDDNQDGDRDGDGSNTKGCGAGDSKPLPFACPFNKKYPSIYDRFYRSPNGKGEYSTCESGFDTYQRFK
jgi:hypothetical protein